MAADGASDSNGHIVNINQEFDRNNTVEVLIERPDGSEAMVVMLPPAETLGTLTVLDLETVRAIFAGLRGRFAKDRSALEQLVRLAEALGIREPEISMAIADGRLNPHRDDLFDAFFGLAETSCREMFREITMRLRSEGRSNDALAAVQRGCERASLIFDERRALAWNERFGPRPERLATIRVNPTVVSCVDAPGYASGSRTALSM
jgi:hypothetical protein